MAFFHFFLNVFFGGLPIKNNERKRGQKMFLKLLWIFFRRGGFQKNVHITPYRVSQKYFPLIFKILWVLLSIMVLAGSNFACILMWCSRNRIWDQIFNVSVRRPEIWEGTSVGSDFLSPALMNLQSPNSTHIHLRTYII